MNISRKVPIRGDNFVTTLYQEDPFPHYLELELSFSGEQFLEKFEWGYVDLQYILFDGFPETKRIIINYQDFLEQPFVHKINAGEFISSIKIGGYFYKSEDCVFNLLVKLKEVAKPSHCNFTDLSHLHEAILFGPSIDFLEQCRSFDSDKFLEMISAEKDNLEGRIDEASGRAFNYWVLADTITKSQTDSKPLSTDLVIIKDRYVSYYKERQQKTAKYIIGCHVDTGMNSKFINEYLDSVGQIHNTFVKEHKSLISQEYPDLFIDFEEWSFTNNVSGFASVWIEPKEPKIYRPAFNSPIKEIEISGVQLIIKAELIENGEKVKSKRFEITGHFNPREWHGRNKLDIQSTGKIVTSGFNKIIIEEYQVFSEYFLKYLQDNYRKFLDKCIQFYFKSKENF